MIKLETIKAMTLGIAVADAMGVPVEFKSRSSLKKKAGNRNVGLWKSLPTGRNMVR